MVFCLSVYNRHVVRTFTLCHWAVCQISSLHDWAAWKHGLHVTRKTGLHVFLSTLHLRTLYIENHGPVKLFTYMYIVASTVKCIFDWSTPRQRVAVCAHEKWGGLCKICAVWTENHLWHFISGTSMCVIDNFFSDFTITAGIRQCS